MQHLAYVGSGPYCYANSFAMLLGEYSPSTAVIEVATGSPFGMQLIGGKTVFFDAYGWNPEVGFDQALRAIGWTSAVRKGGDAREALGHLATASRKGPVWVGPLEMGHLHHQPEMTGPIGADHYVVVLEVDDERVLVHDPQGYPYACVPVGDFMMAWRAPTQRRRRLPAVGRFFRRGGHRGETGTASGLDAAPDGGPRLPAGRRRAP